MIDAQEDKMNELNQILLRDAEKGDFVGVATVVTMGADLNARDRFGQTALMKAILGEDKRMALYLIEKGADLDATDCFKNTALMYTAFQAQQEVFETLLKKGASVHHENQFGENVAQVLYRLYQQSDDKKKPIYQEMISEFVPDFVAREKQKALSLAIVNGFENLVSVMVQDNDVNVNETDGAKVAPLHWAAAFNRGNAAYCLIAFGAEVDLKTNLGMTPLMYAAQNGYQEMVGLLLSCGADASLKNKNQKTAVDLALMNGHNGIVQMINGSEKKICSAQQCVPQQDVFRQKGDC